MELIKRKNQKKEKEVDSVIEETQAEMKGGVRWIYQKKVPRMVKKTAQMFAEERH